MFGDCQEVETIDISYYNISSEENSKYLFERCFNLKTLIIRGFGNYVLNSNAFNAAYNMNGETSPVYNPNGVKWGYIYVPRAMVETLKNTSGWANYNIRALEDYTIDGTTTGNLDKEKTQNMVHGLDNLGYKMNEIECRNEDGDTTTLMFKEAQ
jgi:hypothetical protein